MSTTSAYGWNIPDNTDLVKDGALAIRTLGNAIDTSMNTALGTKKAGMVLLNTTSFSGVSSQSISDVFSATYTNYKILTSLTAIAADTSITLRLRVSGSDASGADYNSGIIAYSVGGGVMGSFSETAKTAFWFGQADTGVGVAAYACSTDLFNPFDAVYTRIINSRHSTDTGGNYFVQNDAGRHQQNTSYTGFTVISSGTNALTGSISVYGYNK